MLNKIISILLFVLLVPIFLVVSLIILIDDGFPIFFSQKRVGINKSIFYIIKFRTMKNDTENIATHLAKHHKSKILKSGNFLRKYSIDEIPQIINIFLGHINFVGPRPALFNQYDLIQLREKYNINSLKPGLTGWAQVNGRDYSSIDKKVEHDYYYFKNKSLLLDFQIIYRTIVKVVLAENVKGSKAKSGRISNFLKNQNKLIKRFVLIANDIALIFLALVSSSLIIEWDYNIPNSVFLVIIGVTSFLFYYRGIHDNVIKNIGLRYLYTVMGLILSLFLFYSFVIGVIIQDLLLAKIVFVSGFILFFFIILSRITAKFLLYKNVNKEKIILYTDYEDISEAVNLAANSINFELVGIINSKRKNKGRLVNNIKIFGIDDFSKLVKTHNIIKLFIISNNNIKDLDKNLFQQIISFPIKVFKIPDLNDIISKKDSFSDLQHLSLEDFISREVKDDIILREDKDEIIRNKVVLVTGAGGSIGSILAKQVLANKPKLLIIIDNSEFALFKIESELRQINCGIKVVPRLINIVDQNLLNTIFKDFDIDTVYHAAAYKHVNILENEIRSAMINNIIGTNNLLIASHSHAIKKFVMISTDKAATPTTVMGKTKKFCELIVQHFNDKDKNSAFLSVRFGNVFNSSGSVIQIFKNQIKKGEDLTLTDPLVDRFFMSIQEAVKLVIQASQMGKGGEVFVLDMGTPIKILDIAKKMIHLSGNTIKTDSNPSGDIGIIITGLKKGEKMHEILSENPIQNTDNPQIMLSTDDRRVSNIEESMKIIIDAIKDNDIELMKKVLDITVYK